jgi:hypothetical protein
MTDPRRCRRCCAEKPLSEYDQNPGYGDGWRKWCRSCSEIPAEYRVYVIELSEDAGPRSDPRYPHVYVGQTGAFIDCRYWQHKNNLHSSSIVRRCGLQLRPDLYSDLPSVMTQIEALALEQQVMEDLRGRGFTVHGA